MTNTRHASARRAARLRRLERRRRRAVVTATSTLAACIMIVSGAFLVAGANGPGSGPQALGSGIEAGEPRGSDETASPRVAATPGAKSTEAPPAGPFCSDAVERAIDSGDAEAVVVAAGGGDAFRDGVLSGRADDCIALNHPAWDWVVVNKHRPIEPIDYAPVVAVPRTHSPIGAQLDPAAAEALDALAAGARDAGAGDIALESGYRSYQTQAETYESQVASLGVDGADLTSARPGYSEHQLGLAGDLVACDGTVCGSMYEFGQTPQGEWVAENAWRYGWIVRYGAHATETTGYEAEPWHLRYIGTSLATAYHQGEFDTYEAFWKLDPAADYLE